MATPEPFGSMSNSILFQVSVDAVVLTCVYREDEIVYIPIRELDAKVIRPKSGDGRTEQAARSNVRQHILTLDIKIMPAKKEEIKWLKSCNVIGKRAPSCSLLPAIGAMLSLEHFGKAAFGKQLTAILDEVSPRLQRMFAEGAVGKTSKSTWINDTCVLGMFNTTEATTRQPQAVSSTASIDSLRKVCQTVKASSKKRLQQSSSSKRKQRDNSVLEEDADLQPPPSKVRMKSAPSTRPRRSLRDRSGAKKSDDCFVYDGSAGENTTTASESSINEDAIQQELLKRQYMEEVLNSPVKRGPIPDRLSWKLSPAYQKQKYVGGMAALLHVLDTRSPGQPMHSSVRRTRDPHSLASPIGPHAVSGNKAHLNTFLTPPTPQRKNRANADFSVGSPPEFHLKPERGSKKIQVSNTTNVGGATSASSSLQNPYLSSSSGLESLSSKMNLFPTSSSGGVVSWTLGGSGWSNMTEGGPNLLSVNLASLEQKSIVPVSHVSKDLFSVKSVSSLTAMHKSPSIVSDVPAVPTTSETTTTMTSTSVEENDQFKFVPAPIRLLIDKVEAGSGVQGKAHSVL